MIVETPQQLSIENIGANVETLEAGIDTLQLPFIFDMLSGSFYSNAISSICREITSNCCDSHTEANVDEPVLIKRGADEEGTYISFIDVGVGLSKYRMTKVYMNYFSSTKRGSNLQIGGFGLGSKSPMSYCDYFYINTISDKYTFEIVDSSIKAPFNSKIAVKTVKGNKYKYQYLFSKGITKPTLDLLSTTPTNDHNGTEIRIYIKDPDDVRNFRTALTEQLCYFDNVYFDNWSIENDYNIFEGKYFKYRNKNQYSTKMHIVLDKVVYPIDWSQLDMNPVNIAVGVKFQIGELLVTPNREQLRYTDEVIKLVKERITKTIDELVDIFNSQNKGFDSYFEWVSRKSEQPFITFTKPNGGIEKLYLYGLDYVNKRNQYKYLHDLPIDDASEILSLFYYFKAELRNGKVTKDRYNSMEFEMKRNPNRCFISNTVLLTADKNWRVQNGYIYLPNKDKRRFKSLFYVNNYRRVSAYQTTSSYFNLGAGLRIYKLMKALREEVESRCNVYRDLTPEEQADYTEYKREHNTSLQKRLQGKVFVNSISEDNSYDWSLTTNSNDTYYWTKGINSYNGIVIYGFKEDQVKLEKALTVIRHIRPKYFENSRGYCGNNRAFKIIRISRQNEKYFKDKPNMTHVDNLYGDNIIFRDIASSFKIEYFFNDIENSGMTTRNYIERMKLISKEIGELLEQLANYYEKIHDDGHKLRFAKADIKLEILKLANAHNLFNPNVELLFNKINDWFKGVEIIRYTPINDKTLPFILKLLYEKKKKLNIEYYQKVLNTDPSYQLSLKFDDTNPIICTKFNIIINTIVV